MDSPSNWCHWFCSVFLPTLLQVQIVESAAESGKSYYYQAPGPGQSGKYISHMSGVQKIVFGRGQPPSQASKGKVRPVGQRSLGLTIP